MPISDAVSLDYPNLPLGVTGRWRITLTSNPVSGDQRKAYQFLLSDKERPTVPRATAIKRLPKIALN